MNQNQIDIEAQVAYDVWYRKYGGLLKCIQKKYDHSPNTIVRLTRNEIIVITIIIGW